MKMLSRGRFRGAAGHSAFFSQIGLAAPNGGRGNRPAVSSYRFLPPPSDQTEEQARFECMRLVRAAAISDAELLRLRDSRGPPFSIGCTPARREPRWGRVTVASRFSEDLSTESQLSKVANATNYDNR
jgi:hypothetical protein